MFSTIFVHLAKGRFLCSLPWGMILYLTLQIRRSHAEAFIRMLSEVADSEGRKERAGPSFLKNHKAGSLYQGATAS